MTRFKKYIYLICLIISIPLWADFFHPASINHKTRDYLGGLCEPGFFVVSRFFNQEASYTNPSLYFKIRNILASIADYYSFELYDPVTQFRIFINPKLNYHAASTYKTSILIAIMKMDQENEISLENKIKVYNEFKSKIDKSPFTIEHPEDDILYDFIDNELTIRELVEAMIIYSSNLATNILIDYFTADKLNFYLNLTGSDITIQRGVSDLKAFNECIDNTVNSKSLTSLYEIILNPEIFDQDHRMEMTGVLTQISETDGIPASIPEEAIFAHKPGYTSHVFHDAGFIIIDNEKPFFITILTSNYNDLDSVKEGFTKIGNLVLKEVSKERKFKMNY